MAESGHNASNVTSTTFTTTPHFQPSFFAMGLPSSTRFGVAIHVLRKSIPRANTSSTSINRYSRLPNGTVSSMGKFSRERTQRTQRISPPLCVLCVLCVLSRPRFSLLPVNLFRRLQLRLGDFEFRPAILDRTEEARLVTLVTRRADLLDLNQQRIAVAIERDVLHLLRVAAALALH